MTKLAWRCTSIHAITDVCHSDVSRNKSGAQSKNGRSPPSRSIMTLVPAGNDAVVDDRSEIIRFFHRQSNHSKYSPNNKNDKNCNCDN
eukprot:559115-Amphidinium_carterae.1